MIGSSSKHLDRLKSAKENNVNEIKLSSPMQVDRMQVSMTQMGTELNKIREMIPVEESFKNNYDDSVLSNKGLVS